MPTIVLEVNVSQIIWEDPPNEPDDQQRFIWHEALTEVMASPEQWAAVRSYDLEHSARASLSQLRNNKIEIPAGDWTFTVAKRDDAKHWVYARYNGPSKP